MPDDKGFFKLCISLSHCCMYLLYRGTFPSNELRHFPQIKVCWKMQNFSGTKNSTRLRSSFTPQQQIEIKRWAPTSNLLKVERESLKDDDKGKPEVILVNSMKVTWNPRRNQALAESSFVEALFKFFIAILKGSQHFNDIHFTNNCLKRNRHPTESSFNWFM